MTRHCNSSRLTNLVALVSLEQKLASEIYRSSEIYRFVGFSGYLRTSRRAHFELALREKQRHVEIFISIRCLHTRQPGTVFKILATPQSEIHIWFSRYFSLISSKGIRHLFTNVKRFPKLPWLWKRVFKKCFWIDSYCYDSASFYRFPSGTECSGDFWSFSLFIYGVITDVTCISIFIRFFDL